MSGRLWATRGDRRRLRRARSAVLMVGGYDGSGNYGDVLQLAAALETVSSLPGSPLPVVIIERTARRSHASLLGRFPDHLGGPVYAHFDEHPAAPSGLHQLEPGTGPDDSVLYLYGGGYLNHWWGGRKVAFAEAAEGLAGAGPLPLVASGLQVEEKAVAPGGPAHELISRAAWIGARDARSVEALRANLPQDGDRVVHSGDDAMPLLDRGPAVPEAVINIHLNSGHWVSDEPEEMIARVVAMLRRLGEAWGRPLELQPVVAYEDDRISEAGQVAELIERYRRDLEGAGLTPIPPLELLADAAGDDLRRFRRARFTLSCSYHVALTSLLAGIPTMLLSENRYYDQKSAGLRDLFGLDRSLVGVRGGPEHIEAASEAMNDGPGRAGLIERLRDAGRRVVEHQRAGRADAAAALAGGLCPPGELLRRLRVG